MDLRHKLEESNQARVQMVKEFEVAKARARQVERELTSLQQEVAMKRAGVNPADSQMAKLVQQLRDRIKALEGQSCINSGRQQESVSSLHTGHNLGGNSLFTLKEEYCSKLEKLVDQNNAEKTHLQNQVSGFSKKNESLAA